MIHVSVKDLVGPNAMTLEDGEALYQVVHDPLVAGQVVELDFDGVELFASPFFNAGISRLLADLRLEVLQTRLKICSLSAFGSRLLRRIMENAQEYYSVSEAERRAIDRIVEHQAELI